MDQNLSASILIVDANRTNLANIARTLKNAGYSRVATAFTGEEAWECLQRTYFDVLIIEWMLPTLSGIDLIKKVRKYEAHRHGIVVVTLRRDLESVLHAVESGADAFMLKPFTDEVLISKVAEVERKSSPVRSQSRTKE